MTKQEMLLIMKFEDEILDIIEIQLRNDENSLTQSDLQGVVGAIVMNIINSKK